MDSIRRLADGVHLSLETVIQQAEMLAGKY